MRIAAYILNGLLILVGVQALLRWDYCGIFVGLGAGIFNMIALYKGEVDASDHNITMAANAVAVIWGMITGIAGISALMSGDPMQQTLGLMQLMIAAVFLLAGIVTLVAIVLRQLEGDDDQDEVAPG